MRGSLLPSCTPVSRLRNLVEHLWCGSTLIAHEKSQEGSKGGNGFFHLRWVLPVVGSKAIVDHTSLVNLHADGEGESGAYKKNSIKINAPDSPSPQKREARPLIAIGTTPYLPLPKSVVLLEFVR